MKQFIVRDIRNGDWYWISRFVLQEYGPKIGILALSIYNFLASMADEKQSCFPSQSYIAKNLGCSRGSVSRGLKVLRDYNLIAVEIKSRYVRIYYLLDIGSSMQLHHVSSPATNDVQKAYINNKRIIKEKNVNVSDSIQNSQKEEDDFIQTLVPQNREELLAKDIAEGLNDYPHIQLYLEYAYRFPENILRKVLAEVRQKPIHKIKRSRGALYTYLINKYGQGKIPDINH